MSLPRRGRNRRLLYDCDHIVWRTNPSNWIGARSIFRGSVYEPVILYSGIHEKYNLSRWTCTAMAHDEEKEAMQYLLKYIEAKSLLLFSYSCLRVRFSAATAAGTTRRYVIRYSLQHRGLHCMKVAPLSGLEIPRARIKTTKS